MIVVAGEALMDLIVAPDGSVAANPGGGPYNTARTIARLGQPVMFLGRISSDRFGRRPAGEPRVFFFFNVVAATSNILDINHALHP